MLGSNDVSNDANSNRHANVTDVTQKAHGCRYNGINCCQEEGMNRKRHDKVVFWETS